MSQRYKLWSNSSVRLCDQASIVHLSIGNLRPFMSISGRDYYIGLSGPDTDMCCELLLIPVEIQSISKPLAREVLALEQKFELFGRSGIRN